MSQTIQVQSDTVPAGFCPPFFNSAEWFEIVDLLHIELPDCLSTVIISDTAPGPDYLDSCWFKTSSDYPVRPYVFKDGKWLARHPIAVGFVLMTEAADAAAIAALDESGAVPADPVTTTSGAFWEPLAAMAARMPIHPGTLPVSSTVVNVTNTGGIEKHVLTVAEMPSHTHNSDMIMPYNGARALSNASANDSALLSATTATGGGTAHENMPPYYGIWFVRRTARLYYVG